MPVIPDLPGELVPPHSDQESWLKALVAKLCGLDRPRQVFRIEQDLQAIDATAARFPGSQPVSFGGKDLDKLESKECVSLSNIYIYMAMFERSRLAIGFARNQMASASYFSFRRN